jgi:hypothetical protein
MAEPLNIHRARQLPDQVVLLRDDLAAPRFTPRELRTIKEAFGRSLGQLIVDDETDDKFAALAWIKLRRQGVDADLADLDDVVIEIRADEVTPVDPSSGGSSTGSPPSAATGG